MSGPKCDFFELAEDYYEQEQREMQRQLREERRRLREEARLRRIEEENRRREAKRRYIEEQKRLKEEECRRREEEERIRREQERLRMESEIRHADDFDQEMNAAYMLLKKADEKRSLYDETVGTDNSMLGEFEEAYADYLAAVSLSGTVPMDINNGDNLKEKIDKLKIETERLNELVLDKLCKKKVNEIIDETIEEMGYNLIAKQEDEANAKFSSSIYQYDEETAISILSVNGQFTMEVVAMDEVDRFADAGEAKMLKNHMESFCGDYQKLIDKLESDGRLTRRNVYKMPPAEQYARVVNTSKYQKKKLRKHDESYEALQSTGKTQMKGKYNGD